MSDVLIKLTGLWERERRGNPGNVYWTGRLGAAKILVFRNNRKEFDADPDYNVFITEPAPPRQDQQSSASPPRSAGDAVRAGAGRGTEPLTVEPIPPGGDEVPW